MSLLGSGYLCGMGSIPGPGISACGKKKKKKGQEREKMPNIKQTVEKQLPGARGQGK